MRKFRAIGFAAAAVLAALTIPAGGSTLQTVHYGHYGDVRALCRVGDSLWVGTGGGLFIYELGRSEPAARLLVGDELPSNSVRAVTTRGDSVFVGTDRGLSVFSGGKAAVLTNEQPGPYAGVPFESIRRIDFGLDGAVYLSTFGSGLGVLRGDTSWVITREDSLLDDKVYGMIQEDDTTFYYATSMGLCAYRDSVWVNFQAGAGIPRAEVKKILAAPDAGYFILVGGRGVYRFNGYRAQRITDRNLVPENMVSDIVIDSRGNLWLCGGLGGIAVYQNGHWTRINEGDEAFNRERWRCSYADGEGGVFFGSGNGLIVSINDNLLTRLELPKELTTGGVSAVTSDSSGAVYVLDGSSLFRIQPGDGTLGLDFESPDVVDVTVSPQGGLWAATRWGIYYRRGGEYVQFEPQVPETSPLYSVVRFDAEGNLWAGSHDGNVFRYDGEIWMRMGDGELFAFGSVQSLDFDGAGRLWVIGSNKAVWMFDGRRWTQFGAEVFGELPAVALAVSPTGVPVLVTRDNVWGYEAGGQWKTVALAPGPGEAGGVLGADETSEWKPGKAAILSVTFDADGRLFLGTDDGVVVADGVGTRWIRSGAGLGGISAACLYVEQNETLWIGFKKDGLTRIDLKSRW